ncbi:MAG: sulfurtransferase [Alphaproteobacteria bacterium]|nr:sulfurtransferase [Alphaproteobacteria bacterium]
MIENFVKTGLIEPSELSRLLEKEAPSLRILDATFVLPGSEINPKEEYKKEHIKNAVFFDIDDISDKSSPLPHMLPNRETFEKGVSALGISNDDLIVVYAQHGMIMGPARVWWMFRTFGHNRIAVLNGGLPAWKAEGYITTNTVTPEPTPTNYKIQIFRPELVTDMKCVNTISESGECPIFDARPKERFDGHAPEPRAGMRAGHIPGSHSIPCSTLIEPQTGKLKEGQPLKDALIANGAVLPDNNTDRIIATCGSGITACVIALALYHLDYKEVSVYDGSWSEWGRSESATKVATSS